MMKTINWKKYAGAAMAAAMIPAVVAPIATEASGLFSVTEGKNVVITLDGKHTLVGEESKQWFAKKQIKLVSQEDGKTYTANKNGVIWVPATYGKGLVYDVYDLKGKKTSMTVWPSGSTKAVLDYSAEAKATLSVDKDIQMTVDGKTANDLLKDRTLRLVNIKNPNDFYTKKAGETMFSPTVGRTYDIYDLTDVGTDKDAHKKLESKGQIVVDIDGNTTGATLNYSTFVKETKTVSVADLNVTGFAYDGIYKNDQYAELLINNQKKRVSDNNVMAHAPSAIKFNLEGQNFTQFTGYVGLDARRPNGLIKVQVFIDGREVGTPDYQKPTNNASHLNVYIPSNAKTLEIRATGVQTSDNPNENAMFVLAGGQFQQQVKAIK